MNTATTTQATGEKVNFIARLSFPDIFKPRQGLARPDGTPGDLRYGGQFIVDPNGPDAAVLKAAAVKVANAKWGANGMTVLGSLESSKKCIRNGNMNLAKDGTIREGYQGMMYVVARSKAAPLVLADKFHQGKPVHIREDGSTWQNGIACPVEWKVNVPYGGCYVRVQIEVYAMEGSGAKAQQGKSINATLLAIQFARDGTAFSGSRADESDFSEIGGPPAGTDPMGNDPFATDPLGAAQQAPSDPFAM